MAPEVVNVDPELQAFGEPPSRAKQVDGLLRPPAEPGVLSRVEQSRGAQLGRFGEPRRFGPGARGGRVARALASSLRGPFERLGSGCVPPARGRGEVPGSAIDVIGAAHHTRQRLVGRTTIGRGCGVIDRRSCQRMYELDALRTLVHKSSGRLSFLYV